MQATATFDLELPTVRRAGALLIGAGAVYSLLPHPAVACPLRTLTGVPCPLCGMTRAFSAAVRGDIAASIRFNPGGVLLLLAVIASFAAWRSARWKMPTLLIPTVLVLMWVWNLTLNPTFH